MNYKVKTISVFEKQAKKLIKKYPSLKHELLELVHELRRNPSQGIPLGKNCFKIRIAISSKGKGKSGGGRIITNFVVTDNTVFLLTIYDKSQQENITEKELEALLEFLPV